MAALYDVRFLPLQRFWRWVRSVAFEDYWMVGLIDEPIKNALTWSQLPSIRWLAPFDRNFYLADPFPWPGSTDTILVEEFDTKTRLGEIVALKVGLNEVIDKIKVDLPINGHLSFPLMFLYEGSAYVMPESSASRRLEIFKWQENTGTWVPYALVFDDQAVADAVLFQKDGLFWIAYTDVTSHPHDNLNLIYASALKGPWLRHPSNPVQRGKAFSRNGGALFEVDGRMYRPAQDCSRVYGGSLRIMEIVTCTQTHYEEREIKHIMPSARNYSDGFHTLQAWGDKCLVDGMRLVFSPRLIGQKILKKKGIRRLTSSRKR